MSHPETQTNRLAHESSLYLRQHATNPVDWYPWGPEALERARSEQKPIFLSIGYAACHWCHVMEDESFVDPDTAQLMNDHFINIKVDREERPDLDQIYMNAVVAMTGQGGWPMSVFLTPDLKPFYGGTYFPPQDAYGRPSFRRILQSVAQAWEARQGEVLESADQIANHLRAATNPDRSESPLKPQLIRQAADVLERVFDPHFGGFGQAPKFPHPLEIKLLLRAWKRFDLDASLAMTEKTLERMALGGIYDHLGGGFHRYSTDARWLVPHFEKMLYDNALLSQVYIEAYQATGNAFYREVVEETLAWVLRDMVGPEGGFYSTLDADSEGHEGKFYVWSLAEVTQLLGQEQAELFCDVYDVTSAGNWEGTNILNRRRSLAQDAKVLKMAPEELARRLTEGRRQLLAARAQRVHPNRDEKVLTAWNGLTIAAFAQAAQVLDPRYSAPAEAAASFLLGTMRTPDGRLMRTYSTGYGPKLNAYLEDYAALIDSLVSLYEATFAPGWLQNALELTEIMIEDFWDEAEGGFYFVSKNHEQLLYRSKEAQDGATPSGSSMAATALLRLGHLSGRSDLAEKGMRVLALYGESMQQSPMAHGQMLCALDFYLGPVEEFAIAAPRGSAELTEVLQALRKRFQPNRVIACQVGGFDGSQPHAAASLLAERPPVDDQVTTYLCVNQTCEQPLVGKDALLARLEAGGE